MPKSTGHDIQNLEKAIIDAMKETELVEHPRFYHRNLNDPREPLTLAYKTAEVYRSAGATYDPFIEVFPLTEFLVTSFPGAIELKYEFDVLSSTHRLHIKLAYSSLEDATQFKLDLLQKINERLNGYLVETGKRKPEGKKHKRHH